MRNKRQNEADCTNSIFRLFNPFIIKTAFYTNQVQSILIYLNIKYNTPPSASVLLSYPHNIALPNRESF